MIPKSSKFPLRTEFLSFRTESKKIPTPHFTFQYISHPTNSRVAVIVSKKTSKLATTRNWIKRITLDTLWPLVKDKNLDCVIGYKPLPLRKSTNSKQELIHELTQTFSHI